MLIFYEAKHSSCKIKLFFLHICNIILVDDFICFSLLTVSLTICWYWSEKLQVNHPWWLKKVLFENLVETSFFSDWRFTWNKLLASITYLQKCQKLWMISKLNTNSDDKQFTSTFGGLRKRDNLTYFLFIFFNWPIYIFNDFSFFLLIYFQLVRKSNVIRSKLNSVEEENESNLALIRDLEPQTFLT